MYRIVGVSRDLLGSQSSHGKILSSTLPNEQYKVKVNTQADI